MNQLLGELVDVYALVNLDDTLIFLHTKEEHWKHVQMVFVRLAQFNYHFKHNKCMLFSEKVKSLGHTASAVGIGIVLSKADTIKQWP